LTGVTESSVLEPGFPSSVYLGLSYLCNMHCEHCYAIGSDRSASLTQEEVFRLIDELDQLFCCNIIFGHGEPFIYPNFFDVLRKIKSKRINSIIMTNGSVLDIGRIKMLAQDDVKPHIVKVSLDGRDPQHHDTNRNHKGAFARAVAAIEGLRDVGIDVRIATVIDIANPWACVPLVDYAREMNLSGISMLTIRDKRNYSSAQMRDYVEAVRCILKSLDENSPFEVMLHDPLIFSLLGKDEIPEALRDRFRLENECSAGTERIAIQPDGTVTPCNLMPDTIVGNIRDQSIADIWYNSPHLRRIRQSFVMNDIAGCGGCAHHEVCHGGCLAFGSVEVDRVVKDYRCTDHGEKVLPQRRLLQIVNQ